MTNMGYMRLNHNPRIFFIVLFVIVVFLSAPSFAQDSTAYGNNSDDDLTFAIINPESMAPVAGYPESLSRMDIFVSFWELPLWIKISYLSIIVIGIISAFKLIPFVFGRLKSALENPKTKDIFFYVKKFSEDEIVELRQDGKYKRCYVKQEARMILLRYKAN
jgi:hypothetical protein